MNFENHPDRHRIASVEVCALTVLLLIIFLMHPHVPCRFLLLFYFNFYNLVCVLWCFHDAHLKCTYFCLLYYCRDVSLVTARFTITCCKVGHYNQSYFQYVFIIWLFGTRLSSIYYCILTVASNDGKVKKICWMYSRQILQSLTIQLL